MKVRIHGCAALGIDNMEVKDCINGCAALGIDNMEVKDSIHGCAALGIDNMEVKYCIGVRGSDTNTSAPELTRRDRKKPVPHPDPLGRGSNPRSSDYKCDHLPRSCVRLCSCVGCKGSRRRL